MLAVQVTTTHTVTLTSTKNWGENRQFGAVQHLLRQPFFLLLFTQCVTQMGIYGLNFAVKVWWFVEKKVTLIRKTSVKVAET